MTIKDVVESHLRGAKSTIEPEIREILLAGVVQVVIEAQLDGRLRYMRIAEVTDTLFAGWWTVVWGEYPVGGGNGFDARTFGPVAHVLGFLDVWVGTFGCEADLPALPRDEVERRLQMAREENAEPDEESK